MAIPFFIHTSRTVKAFRKLSLCITVICACDPFEKAKLAMSRMRTYNSDESWKSLWLITALVFVHLGYIELEKFEPFSTR